MATLVPYPYEKLTAVVSLCYISMPLSDGLGIELVTCFTPSDVGHTMWHHEHVEGQNLLNRILYTSLESLLLRRLPLKRQRLMWVQCSSDLLPLIELGTMLLLFLLIFIGLVGLVSKRLLVCTLAVDLAIAWLEGLG